jgi:hypothetical protein
MCNRTFWSVVVVAAAALLSQAAVVQGVLLEGRVLEGDVPDETKPIAGVTVDLWGSNNQAAKGTRIATTTTDPAGRYELAVPASPAYDYYNIVEQDPPDYVSVGATTLVGGGVKIDNNWIQYVGLEGKNLVGNKFFDKKSQPPEEYDYGDAPGLYPTMRGDNGAQHTLTTRFFLGTQIDAEPDGQPSPLTPGLGDDNSNIDDEDGVVFAASLKAGNQYTVPVTVTGATTGVLDAWVDFNRDGDWADAGEQIFTKQTVSQGLNNLPFNVPAAASAGESFARFRLSQAGVSSYTGPGGPGEVEDYRVEIDVPPPQRWDFGDAPQKYPVASHELGPSSTPQICNSLRLRGL